VQRRKSRADRRASDPSYQLRNMRSDGPAYHTSSPLNCWTPVKAACKS
jgi:hypothetical protein